MNAFPARITPEVGDPASNALDLFWWGLSTGAAYVAEHPWTWLVGGGLLALALLPGKRR